MSAVEERVNISAEIRGEQAVGSGTGDSSDDDFGNFSDASFEADNDTSSTSEALKTYQYLDELLPDVGNVGHNQVSENVSLEDLINDERPHVIYEQLVRIQSVLRPFVWNKSHLKASLWHILNIPEETSLGLQLKKKRDPLDDSLLMSIQPLINDSNIHTSFLLKDHFKIEYYPPMIPMAMQEAEEKDQEREIPKYLATDLENVQDLKSYHDTLCHAIDVLFMKLQQLNRIENGLVKDKTTFENVVTNLTGHTQRLYRDEILLYNKKVKRRSKFGW